MRDRYLLQGGQGRSTDELMGGAVVFCACVLLGLFTLLGLLLAALF